MQEWDEDGEDPAHDNPELGWGFLENQPKDAVVPGQVMACFIMHYFSIIFFASPAFKQMGILFPTCRLLSVGLDARYCHEGCH